MHVPIIPGLPDDLGFRCLAKLSHGHQGLLESVSKTWKNTVRNPGYIRFKAKQNWYGNWLFVQTEGTNNQWIAYDPDADRWRPLPKIPYENQEGFHHLGFSCVCVGSKFLVIGGFYAPVDMESVQQSHFATKDVFMFDVFKREWSRVCGMRTARAHFACSVVRGKVYVAGGRKVVGTAGINRAEVYDPLEDRWEELPPMPDPQVDCIGMSYKGCFHVLNDYVGLPDQKPTVIFSPSDRTWRTVEDIWPFSRAMQFAVTVVGDDRIYTVVDWGESSIRTRDGDQGEWYSVGPVPPVLLPGHSRPLEAFNYGFAAHRKDLYVVGGKVLKWEGLDAGPAGRFDIVKLDVVRVCDPTVVPLKWRETRPMPGASGAVTGCAFLEE